MTTSPKRRINNTSTFSPTSTSSPTTTSSSFSRGNGKARTLLKGAAPSSSSSGKLRSIPEATKIVLVVVSTFIICLVIFLAVKNYQEGPISSSSSQQYHRYHRHHNSDDDKNTHNTKSGSMTSSSTTTYDSHAPSSSLSNDQLLYRFLDTCSSYLSKDSFYSTEFASSLTTSSRNRHYYKPGEYCEGYWRSSSNKEGKDADSSSTLVLPFPEAHPPSSPFCGQEDFLEMLRRLEKGAKRGEVLSRLAAEEDDDDGVVKYRTVRGLSTSRLEKDKVLDSNREYFYVRRNNNNNNNDDNKQEDDGVVCCWTGDLAEYYIAKFNVRPSFEFVNAIYQLFGRMTKAKA